MLRSIIQINEALCNGCGACASACHEGAITMVNGKAKLMRDDYCDGLGDCLPSCPTNAISFVERDTLPYDEAAVLKRMAIKKQEQPTIMRCPGSQSQQFHRSTSEPTIQPSCSALQQWPVQIKLVSSHASFFENCNLLIAADCTSYAYSNFHNHFMKNKVTLIGCPKLDMEDYSEKLTEILCMHHIQSITVVRMQVPCCGGIEKAVEKAITNSGKVILNQIYTITTTGEILDENMI